MIEFIETWDWTLGEVLDIPLRSVLCYKLFTDQLADIGRLVRNGCFGGQVDVDLLPLDLPP